MWKRWHTGDFQAAQVNSIFNLQKKKRPDLRSIAGVITNVGKFVKEEKEKEESSENTLTSKREEKENKKTATSKDACCPAASGSGG